MQTVQAEHSTDTMDRVLKQVEDEFVNLGKAGREYVVAQIGKDTTIEKIRKLTQALEQSVEKLKGIGSAEKLSQALEDLPFKIFEELTSNEKLTMAERLLKKGVPSGFATLDWKIKQEVQKAHDLQKEKMQRCPAQPQFRRI